MKLDKRQHIGRRFSIDIGKTNMDKLWPPHLTSPQNEPYVMNSKRNDEEIKNAKMLHSLDFQNGKVVMKMDVTHLEHPFIIGKGGNIIKKISEYTSCLIHFPDTNRYGLGDKSNQVSITGFPKDVEKARFLIRALIPVVINFTIPMSSVVLLQLNPQISQIELTYRISISFKNYDKFSLLVTIRCSQTEFHHHALGILFLMDLLGIKSNEVPVSIKTEIFWPQQNFVIGTKNRNIKKIMQHTGARIILPNKATGTGVDKNSFFITGKLECIFIAWKELMNHLPVTINFDVHESIEIKDEFEKLFCNEGARIDTKPKPRYNSKTVIIKGPERLSKNLLQYRQVLLGLPKIYFDDETKEENYIKFLMISAIESAFQSNACNFVDYPRENLSTLFNDLPNMFHQSQFNYSPQPFASNSFMGPNLLGNQINSLLSSKPPSTKVLSSDKIFHQGKRYGPNNNNDQNIPSSTNILLTDSSDHDSYIKNQNSLNSFGISSNGSNTYFDKNSDNSSLFDDNLEFYKTDYFRKKIMAEKAKHRPIDDDKSSQVPSSSWSGLFFSQSMPAAIIEEKKKISPDDIASSICKMDHTSQSSINYKENLHKGEFFFSYSNCFDAKKNIESFHLNVKEEKCLGQLLWQNGLENHIENFENQEIDYQTFLSLTFDDLLNMGINGEAHNKIMSLIKRENLKNSPAIVDEFKKMFKCAPSADRYFDFN